MTDTQETLVLIKPDGTERNLIGEILRRIEAKGYEIVDLRMFTPDRNLLTQHYEEHEGKPFFEPLVSFMSSGPVVAVVIEGPRCIEGFRALAGATDHTAAADRRAIINVVGVAIETLYLRASVVSSGASLRADASAPSIGTNMMIKSRSF